MREKWDPAILGAQRHIVRRRHHILVTNHRLGWPGVTKLELPLVGVVAHVGWRCISVLTDRNLPVFASWLPSFCPVWQPT